MTTIDGTSLIYLGIGLVVVLVIFRLAFTLLLPIILVAGLIFGGFLILLLADAVQGGTAFQQLIDRYLPQLIVLAGAAFAAVSRVIRGDR